MRCLLEFAYMLPNQNKHENNQLLRHYVGCRKKLQAIRLSDQ